MEPALKSLINTEQRLIQTARSSFSVLSGQRVENISFSDINYISFGEDTIIYTATSKYRTYLSMEEVLRELPANEFFRVSRSGMVALRCMAGLKRNRICIGDYFVPITRHYKQQVIVKLASIINQQVEFYETKIPGSL